MDMVTDRLSTTFKNEIPDTPKWLGTDFQGELNAAVDNNFTHFTTPSGKQYKIIDKGRVRSLDDDNDGIISREITMDVDNKRSLLGLEVLKIKAEVTPDNIEKIYSDNVKTEFVVIEDTSVPYVLKFTYVDTNEMKSLDPDFLPEMDAFEISESIQDFLSSKGFPIYKSQYPEKPENPSNDTNVAKEAKSVKETNNTNNIGDADSPKD